MHYKITLYQDQGVVAEHTVESANLWQAVCSMAETIDPTVTATADRLEIVLVAGE